MTDQAYHVPLRRLMQICILRLKVPFRILKARLALRRLRTERDLALRSIAELEKRQQARGCMGLTKQSQTPEW